MSNNENDNFPVAPNDLDGLLYIACSGIVNRFLEYCNEEILSSSSVRQCQLYMRQIEYKLIRYLNIENKIFEGKIERGPKFLENTFITSFLFRTLSIFPISIPDKSKFNFLVSKLIDEVRNKPIEWKEYIEVANYILQV